jgi:DNA-binding response OmpR family regulator
MIKQNVFIINLNPLYEILDEIKENLNSKFFSKDNLVLKLTEKEIEIILYLNQKKTKHDVADLQKNIWGYSPDMETHTVETHIYRLRKKISNKFDDENFILSHQSGYFI